jgi:hypothetical protein
VVVQSIAEESKEGHLIRFTVSSFLGYATEDVFENWQVTLE